MNDSERFLKRALEVARQGTGTTSPNPMVGALVVRDGEVMAEGFHHRAGEAHAEEVALARAGDRARGSDLYVTLEPCAHQGHRPPCTEVIIGAGIRRVVACIQDPNPLVNGRGFERLEQVGVQVSWGFRQEEARCLNRAYLKWIVSGLPLVSLKAAVTLDGKLADAHGGSRWITSQEARASVQRLRFESDAVLIGVGTALADNPSLSVRHGDHGKSILKVILDSRLRLPPGSRLFDTSRGDRVLVYGCRGADERRRAALREAGAEVIEIAEAGTRPDLGDVLTDLGRRNVLHLLCEGGAAVFTSFLIQGVADRLHLVLAPKLLGSEGQSWVGELGKLRLEEALSLGRLVDVHRSGPDLWLEASLKGD
ncbi:MAG: bifunctional diaminohydroxyphosphoribosylaminopyrimidine deaminase/5-amino-6-(5-phosphoribosylamino)uracil reductase RibD [Acidobacteria bacterium]|nr:bifunctional diaminohydroxyphosphoribosylaminopyrimidine deaminase/5-amino-6-(5-phosphoribosylamino)uracil reductase RibD [Acidobacteriota bacterium]